MPWKKTAIGRFKSGDTIRTDDFRFTLYRDRQGTAVSRMLYNHQADPGENINLAERSEIAETAEAMMKMLKAGMGRDQPQSSKSSDLA